MNSSLNRSCSDFEDAPILYIHSSRGSEWLPDVPSHLIKHLSESERLRPRLSQIIVRRYELEACPAIKNDIDHAIALLNHATLSRAAGIAGAIWYGRTLSRLIGKEALGSALSVIDDETFRLAVAHADLAPIRDSGLLEASPPTKEALLRDGDLCFIAWLNSLPASLAKRVALKFPPDFESGTPSPDHGIYGPAIIRKCGEAFVVHE